MDTIIGKEELLLEGGELIKQGKLVAFPTETVYGLGANAYDADAVASIFAAKGRPQDNPLIVHISCAAELNDVAQDIPDAAYKLLDAFAPGPLTIVLKRGFGIPKTTTGGLETVGVRIPNHPLALGLIRAAGVPIAAPSANASGRVSPTCASHVAEDLGGRIPMIIDGGKTRVGIESTVLDLTKDTPVILRPGAITAQMLAPILGSVKTYSGEVIVAESPGMKYKHYSPICPCVGVADAQVAKLQYKLALQQGKNPVLIATDSMIKAADTPHNISLGSTPEVAMSLLFSSLRDAEKQYDYILLQWFDDDAYYPIQNRIKKAVGGILI